MEFSQSRRHKKSGIRLGLGCWIWWQTQQGDRKGPAQIWLLALSKHRRWAYVEYEGDGIWVCEDVVTEIVRGTGRLRKVVKPPKDDQCPSDE